MLHAAARIAHYPPVGRRKTGMKDGELKEPARPQNARCFLQGLPVIGHVHQRHECGGKIECLAREGKILAVGYLIVNSQRRCIFARFGMADEGRRHIDGLHLRAQAHQLARVGSLAAADVQAAKPAQVGQQGQKRRRVLGVAVDVVAGTHEARPVFRIGFPELGDLGRLHDLLPTDFGCR